MIIITDSYSVLEGLLLICVSVCKCVSVYMCLSVCVCEYMSVTV